MPLQAVTFSGLLNTWGSVMKKAALSGVIALCLAAGPLQAQTLQPQMSAQDIRAATEVEASHVFVPIMMMIVLLLTSGGGAGAGPMQVMPR
jgi:hypothetical protein